MVSQHPLLLLLLLLLGLLLPQPSMLYAMFLSAFANCFFLLARSRKTTKFGGKVAHGSRKKPLDFGVIRIMLR